MVLSCIVSEIDGDFSRKSQFFSSAVNFAPQQPKGFTLEFSVGAWCQKTRMMALLGQERCHDDIYSRLGTMHERNGRTDGRTPDDSKYRANA